MGRSTSGRRCANGFASVYRVYNGRFAQNDSNHRYLIDGAKYNAMQAQGWRPEGPVMCSPDPFS